MNVAFATIEHFKTPLHVQLICCLGKVYEIASYVLQQVYILFYVSDVSATSNTEKWHDAGINS